MATTDGKCRMSIYSFCQYAGLLHDTMLAPPQKPSIVGDLHLRGLTMNPALLGISLQERQERVGLSRFGSDVSGIVGWRWKEWKHVLS